MIRALWDRRELILLALLLVAAAALQVQRCHYAGEVADVKRERNNARADADSLRLVAQDARQGIRLWERRAWTAEGEVELLGDSLALLAAHLEQTERTAKVVARMYAELRDRRVIESTAAAAPDSTVIAFGHADSTFAVDVRSSFPGRIAPNPQPAVRSEVSVRAFFSPILSISCDEDEGAPFAEALTFDDRVTVSDLRVQVDEDVACLARIRPTSFFQLRPELTLGNTLLDVGLFGLGIMIGRGTK